MLWVSRFTIWAARERESLGGLDGGYSLRLAKFNLGAFVCLECDRSDLVTKDDAGCVLFYSSLRGVVAILSPGAPVYLCVCEWMFVEFAC